MIRRILMWCAISPLVACGHTSPTQPYDSDKRIVAMTLSGPVSLTAFVRHDSLAARMHTVVTIGNRTDAPLVGEYGGCWIVVRLFTQPTFSGTPVFENLRPEIDCVVSLGRFTVPPRSSVDAAETFDIAFLRRSGVSPGTYYVLVSVAPNGVVQRLPAGSITLP